MMSRMNYDFVDVERSRISTTAMPQWLPDDRNNIMHVSYSDRAAVRECPMNRPGRSLHESEMENPPTPPVRRRIGLACARCRKRKIKCSGDLGNGMGCLNCRNSGADTCNFYRVGAQEVSNFPLGASNCHGFASTPSLASVPIYPPQSYGYSRSYPYAQSELNLTTKHLGGTQWSTGGYDPDSPIESYGTLASHGMPTNEPYSVGYPLHDGGRPWHSISQRQTINVTGYADPIPIQAYSTIPISAPAHRNTMLATTDQNMLSGHAISLHPQMHSQTDRVLPMPNLRQQSSLPPNVQEVSMKTSALTLNPGSSQSGLPVGYQPRASLVWTSENVATEARNQSITSSSSSSEAMAPPPSKTSSTSTSISESSSGMYRIGDMDGSSAALIHNSLPHSTQQYSRSRNITLSIAPTSSFHHQETPLYTYGSEKSRNSIEDGSNTEDTLVSGRKYEPLVPQSAELDAKGAASRKPSFDGSASPIHHRTMATATPGQSF